MTTIGVSVPVPPPWGPQLQAYRVRLGDATAAGIPTHITLVPPVEVEDTVLPDIVKHLQEAAAEVSPFPVQLRGTGSFRPVSPVVFVEVAAGAPRCRELSAAVRRGPLAVDPPFPYHPHVTVAHDVPDELLDRAYADLASFECGFGVDQVALHVRQGAGWALHDLLPVGAGRT